jgi:hypothetical protein
MTTGKNYMKILNSLCRHGTGQVLAIRQLGEGHDRELIVTRQRTDMKIAAMATDAFVELGLGQPIHQLSEHRPAFVPGASSQVKAAG